MLNTRMSLLAAASASVTCSDVTSWMFTSTSSVRQTVNTAKPTFSPARRRLVINYNLCLTGLFFRGSVQVRPVPQRSPREALWGLLVWDFFKGIRPVKKSSTSNPQTASPGDLWGPTSRNVDWYNFLLMFYSNLVPKTHHSCYPTKSVKVLKEENNTVYRDRERLLLRQVWNYFYLKIIR